MQDINGEVLCVSQFTLLASTKKGNKPDFHGALGGDEAKRLYQHFFDKVQEGYGPEKVKNGVFQAMMEVALVNDGPVCLLVNPSQYPNQYPNPIKPSCKQGKRRNVKEKKDRAIMTSLTTGYQGYTRA